MQTSGRGANWAAEITAAGNEYLAAVDGPNPPVPREANTCVTEQLVAVAQEGWRGYTRLVPGSQRGSLVRQRFWEKRGFRAALWLVALLVLGVVVRVLQSGQGTWATAVLAVLLVVLGAAVGPDLTALAQRVRSAIFGGSSSSFATLVTPQQLAARLRRESEGKRPVPDAAELGEVLARHKQGRRGDPLTLVIGEREDALALIVAALADAGPVQCLLPNQIGDTAAWLEDPDVEYPPKHDRLEPTVVYVGDLADLDVRAHSFVSLRERPRLMALGWVRRTSENSRWLAQVFRTAHVIECSKLESAAR